MRISEASALDVREVYRLDFGQFCSHHNLVSYVRATDIPNKVLYTGDFQALVGLKFFPPSRNNSDVDKITRRN